MNNSNGRIEIEMQAGKISLHFGMLAVRMWAEKALENEIKKKKSSDEQAFAYVIHSGRCNYADLKELPFPSFEDSYIIAEEIMSMDEATQNSVWTCFSESRANKLLMDKLPKPEKKSEAENPE